MPAILEAITNNSGTITQEDLSLYCSFNVYLSPTGLSVADARDCYPVLDSCPMHTNETAGMDLANTTGLAYQAVADLCVTGSYQLAGNRNLVFGLTLPIGICTVLCVLECQQGMLTVLTHSQLVVVLLESPSRSFWMSMVVD